MIRIRNRNGGGSGGGGGGGGMVKDGRGRRGEKFVAEMAENVVVPWQRKVEGEGNKYSIMIKEI